MSIMIIGMTMKFHDKETALKHAKKFTADFISDSFVNDYFNNQPYVEKLIAIVNPHGDYGTRFKKYDVDSEEFNKIWDYIYNDIACVLEVEVDEKNPHIVTYSDGTVMYYDNDVLHRLDGPALQRDDYWEYYYKGKKHRLDGPAVSGHYPEDNYYIDGKHYWRDSDFQAAKAKWLEEHRDEQISKILD